MRAGRIVAGAVAVVLLVALLATVFLSRGTVDDAEAEAEARAVDWANTTLFDAVTPEEVAAPILGPDYRELLIIVQAGILSDDRAVRMRLWNPDGTLVFSTDQRDKIDEFIAVDNPQIEAALAGETVSLPTQTIVAPKSGLAGTDEKLFQTFVPLRLEDQLGVSGVAQIDQEYAAIEAEASDTWQTVRLVLVLALTVAVGAFLFTLRRRPAEEAIGAGGEAVTAPTRQDRKALERATKAEGDLAAAVERAEKAEAALAEADGTMSEVTARLQELEERAVRSEERAANAEAALHDAALAATGGEAPRRGVPGVGAIGLGIASAELSAKLDAAEAEREELAGEVGRLRAALAEREAELALAHQGAVAGDEAAELETARHLAAEREQRAIELDQRLVEAMREVGEERDRIAQLEGRLREAEATAAAAAATAALVPTEGTGEAPAAGELRAAQLQLNELQTKLADAEDRLADAEARLAEKATAMPDLEAAHERTTKELEAARAELAKADAELTTAREALAAKDEGAASVKAAEAGAAALGAELAEMEIAMRDLEVRAGQAEERATTAEARVAELESGSAQTVARVEDLEAVRAEGAAELERVRTEGAAELERVRTESAAELERVRAESAAELERVRAETATAPVGEGDVEGLRARIAELEDARRRDVAELQRAQETLANTQFEATQARKRAKELEEQLQRAGTTPATPVPEYVPEPETSFSARLAHLVREHEEPPGTGAAPAATEAPAEEEGLSLRERLARAAAARHRLGPPPSDG
jgi:hypothetical protein